MAVRIAPALVAYASVTGLAFRNGGFDATTWGWVALPLLLLAIGLLAARREIELDRLQAVALLLFCALIGWTALSAIWAPNAGQPLLEAERTTIYAAALAAIILLRPAAELVAGGVLAACVTVAGWALVRNQTGSGPNAGRLAGPVGYANGLGLLAAIGILLALGLIVKRRLRLPAAAAIAVLAPALVLTYSRGSWLALGAGIVVLVALAGRRARLVWVIAAALLVTAVVLAAAHGGGVGHRLLSASGSGRGNYWRVAWREVRAHPALGGGAGTWGRWWLRYRPDAEGALDAHNLYLETLAELGPVGLLLLLAALAVPLTCARRAPPLAAAYVALLVHAAFDWDWELPAVLLAGLLCGAALLGGGRPVMLRRGGRAAAVAVALAAAAGVFVLQVGNAALAAGHARTAERWQPWSTQPQLELGEAALEAGDVDQAARELRAAVRRDPGDWELWYQLALASSGRAREHALTLARGLNPFGPAGR